jgi:hypothetical protein
VRSIGRQAGSFWPHSRRDIDELVSRAENELYGVGLGRSTDPAEIRALWARIRQGMKQREMTVGG